VALVILNGFVIFLPQGFWGTVVPVALLFPMLLWLAARCHPGLCSDGLPSSVDSQLFWRQHSASAFSATPACRSPSAFWAHRRASWPCRFAYSYLLRCLPNDVCTRPRSWRAARGLQEALTELRLLYENAPIGLAFLTPDCRYRQINRRLTEICGISIAGHIGKSVRKYRPASRGPGRVDRPGDFEDRGAITGIEVNGQRPDGSNAERVWITYWHPLKAKDGAILGINVVAEEITEQKCAKAACNLRTNPLEARTLELTNSLEELRAAQDRLVQTQKLASLGQLTAGIAHEIKNPLNFVNNFSGVSADLIDELQEVLGGTTSDDETRRENRRADKHFARQS